MSRHLAENVIAIAESGKAKTRLAGVITGGHLSRIQWVEEVGQVIRAYHFTVASLENEVFVTRRSARRRRQPAYAP